MIPLSLRGRLFAREMKPSGLNFPNMPVFSLLDILSIKRMGIRELRWFNQAMTEYRRHITDVPKYSIVTVYPRTFYRHYYYLLFKWATICECIDDVLHNPDQSLISELFMCYFIQIDSIIDQNNDNIPILQPYILKTDSNACAILNELIIRTNNTHILRFAKHQIFKNINSYRRECLLIYQENVLKSSLSFSDIIEEKEITVGGLYSTWSSILCDIYCIPPHLKEISRNVFVSIGMATQILDDLLDLPLDYSNNVNNIVWSILLEEKDEYLSAITYHEKYRTLWSHLDFAWARENLPITMRKSQDMINKYLMCLDLIDFPHSSQLSAMQDLRDLILKANISVFGT